jgi:hypothetical protein
MQLPRGSIKQLQLEISDSPVNTVCGRRAVVRENAQC